MIKKVCDICGKEEVVGWEDIIYHISLESNILGAWEDNEKGDEKIIVDGIGQCKDICEDCIKKLGFSFKEGGTIEN
jgi:hypothetical protein